MKVKIYILIDPITCKIRYIGRTTQSLNKRLIGHISKSKLKQTHRDFWIQSLLKQGLIPKIKELKTVEGWSYSHEIEKNYIKKALKYNFKLTNHDDRGEGCKNKIITDFQKLKISNTLKYKYENNIIKPTNTTKISIYDLNGNFIKEFNSCSECVKILNVPQSSLEKVLSQKVKRWKNYQITYGENPGKYNGRLNFNQNNKNIFIYDNINNKILEFESFKLAAKYLKVSSPTIRRYINKLYKKQFYISNARIKLDEFRETPEVDNPELSL
jgi:hypothetical protein